MPPQLAAARERGERREDLRGSGQKQRISDEEAADQLPDEEPAEDGEDAGEIEPR